MALQGSAGAAADCYRAVHSLSRSLFLVFPLSLNRKLLQFMSSGKEMQIKFTSFPERTPSAIDSDQGFEIEYIFRKGDTNENPQIS